MTASVHTRMYTCTHTCTCARTCMHTQTQCTRTDACTHALHTCTHTHILRVTVQDTGEVLYSPVPPSKSLSALGTKCTFLVWQCTPMSPYGEAEAGGLLRAECRPELHIETLSHLRLTDCVASHCWACLLIFVEKLTPVWEWHSHAGYHDT